MVDPTVNPRKLPRIPIPVLAPVTLTMVRIEECPSDVHSSKPPLYFAAASGSAVLKVTLLPLIAVTVRVTVASLREARHCGPKRTCGHESC